MFFKVLLLTALPAGVVMAQSEAPANAPASRKVTIYLAADGGQLASAEGADHRADINMRDSVGGIMREFYPSGKTWRVIPFMNVEQGIRHGVATSFSEDGKMLTRQGFLGGQAEGEWLVYYPSGSVKSRTQYQHDAVVSQECFTAAGAGRPCPPADTAPQYPGGEAELIKTLLKKVKYPAGPLLKTYNGRAYAMTMVIVRLELHVDTLGAVTEAVVQNAPNAQWKAAVLKAVPSLKPFGPAVLDGHLSAQVVIVPLTFTLDQHYDYSRPQHLMPAASPGFRPAPASVPRHANDMPLTQPSGGQGQ
jgi:hypothetical protein